MDPIDLSHILYSLGEDRADYFQAVSPPIMQTSNFAFPTVEALRQAFEDEMGGYLYSRGLNPTVDILRKKLAALDGAEDALVVNSGASAIFASVLAQVKAGDHIVSVRNPYTWAKKMFEQILPRFGVQTSYVDGRDIRNFEAALRPQTSVIYLESPNSWDYQVQDLEAVAALARERGIVTICDNSYATPLYQRPIDWGIDISIQSATKYLNGHSDVVAGVIAGSAARMRAIFESEYLNAGLGIQPFNAWLVLRGLRTLPARLEKITRTTQAVYAFLKNHPKVEEVIFPGAPDFPQAALVQKQMSGSCGLLTFTYRTQRLEEIEAFCNHLKRIMMAVSWGGHESLIIPRCAGMPKAAFNRADPSHRWLRLYVGLEEPDYLIHDLEWGFSQAAQE